MKVEGLRMTLMTLPEVQVGGGNLFFFWTNRLTSGVLNHWSGPKNQ